MENWLHSAFVCFNDSFNKFKKFLTEKQKLYLVVRKNSVVVVVGLGVTSTGLFLAQFVLGKSARTSLFSDQTTTFLNEEEQGNANERRRLGAKGSEESLILTAYLIQIG